MLTGSGGAALHGQQALRLVSRWLELELCSPVYDKAKKVKLDAEARRPKTQQCAPEASEQTGESQTEGEEAAGFRS